MAGKGFNKEVQPDKILAKIVGSAPISRAQITSKLWTYIRKHELQNPKNKKNIIADEKLKPFFGKKEITMFEMAKCVSAHISDIKGEGEEEKDEEE